jgi:hypothetical protein
MRLMLLAAAVALLPLLAAPALAGPVAAGPTMGPNDPCEGDTVCQVENDVFDIAGQLRPFVCGETRLCTP